MRRVFLSHSFAERDRALVGQVEALIRSHGLVATTGRHLGGGGITPEVAARITAADALVAVLRSGRTIPETSPIPG